MANYPQAVLFNPDLYWAIDNKVQEFLKKEGRILDSGHPEGNRPPFNLKIVYHFNGTTVQYRHCLPTPIRDSSTIETELTLTAENNATLDSTVKIIQKEFPQLARLPAPVSHIGINETEYEKLLEYIKRMALQ